MISRVGPSGGLASATGDKRECSGQGAEHLVERLAERLRIDVADHRDHQLVAGEDAVDIVLEVVGEMAAMEAMRALDRAAVRMVLKGKPVPGERSHRLGIVLVEFQPRQNLGAHALGRILDRSGAW